MSPVVITLVAVGSLIVLALALYAGKLIAQVKEQQNQAKLIAAQRQADLAKQNNYLIDSIQLIAKAVLEQQCELSEAAIRICRLLEKVYTVKDEHYPGTYPALHELDSFLADYPTHEGYKSLKKQERMRFDVERAKQELKLKEAIEQECQSLISFSIENGAS